MKEYGEKAVTAAAVVILLYFAGTILPWLILWIGTALLPGPPSPEITYGEFPLRIIYEAEGEIQIYEDTLVCEFAGVFYGGYQVWEPGRL